MSVPVTARPAAPQYELNKPLDGSSWAVRENLVDILQRELIGPTDGPDELIAVQPDNRYLLGRIAPTKLRPSATDETPAGADDELMVDLGDDLDARQSSGVPVTSVDDSSADADEDNGGDRDDEPVRRGLMIPASMGLRFQVPRDLSAFDVHASWGVYNSEKTGELNDAGQEVRKYRRSPIDQTIRVEVARLKPGQTTDFDLVDDVKLRVDVYQDDPRQRLLVEVALCNDRETPRRIPANAWMFQTKLSVDAPDGAVFLPVHDLLLDTDVPDGDELQRLELQYRNRLEFAIGRTCSVDWHEVESERRADRVWTTWMPTAEIPQTQAQVVPGAELNMVKLAEADPSQLEAGLRPIIGAYGLWLDDREAEAARLPAHLRTVGLAAVAEARQIHQQLVTGLEFLLSNPDAQKCFRFMNRAMADQRVHSQIADLRDSAQPFTLAEAKMKVLARDSPHSWRVFQLAFVLMQIPAMTDPAYPRRSSDLAQVELLFFPTGGGKTEAYLGLAAYTFAIRRLQGNIESTDGKLNGDDGVAVLMRYTLRLLTSQQFQRATTLVCAAELIRREDPATWGEVPFRIGLWVGSAVSPKRVEDADKELTRVNQMSSTRNDQGAGYRLTVLQLRHCPWCGSSLSSRDVEVDTTANRVYVRCSDETGQCPFREGGQVAEGIPVLTVDEEIYRLVPSFVIATVDKFARLAREGEAAALFGYVSQFCPRHGYTHPDYNDNLSHKQNGKWPAVTTRLTTRLRPPDLIIQDELHLITGALGTTVGLFEVAIDELCRWQLQPQTPDSEPLAVKPLIVASSATVRRAADQVRALYGRDIAVFPPQVLDVSDTFFSKEITVSKENPGRRYIGLSTTGVRLTTAEIQVAQTVLSAAQLLLDESYQRDSSHDATEADPYMTLVSYFSATRELAGMARYVQDDIQNGLSKSRPSSKLPVRYGTDFGAINLGELTSRISSSDITQTLDEMAASFSGSIDSNQERAKRSQIGAKYPERKVRPFDVVLATSMLQVGVDVTRLGLMMVVGQPKMTSEYIQASSRVGRDPSRPGLVVTLGNWARPRDLAHYEQFRYYHETFYKQVEPLSVTPFSVTSLDRGLAGLLVSAARVAQASRVDGLSEENNAWQIENQREFVVSLIEKLLRRISAASASDGAEDVEYWTRQRLLAALGQWEERNRTVSRQRLQLVYERFNDSTKQAPLIRSAESTTPSDVTVAAPPFVVANSMREVQPEINLLVSPNPEALWYQQPDGAPAWQAQKAEDAA
ncbi:MAG: DISARM system helicase DrmA [Propionibacteriaceae bacterium]|jgi:hypothetical protein|nr:DISARM system helicase DrmA [Propionibacteriaceae bacterium]